MIHRAKDLSPDQKVAIESLLGHPVAQDEAISIRTLEAASAPEWLQQSWESAKRLESHKRSGTKRVTTEELQSFISLLDAQKDASVIGAMLCAYATCRDVQEPEVPDLGDDNPTETEEPNAEA